jgi:hypothetical protein
LRRKLRCRRLEAATAGWWVNYLVFGDESPWVEVVVCFDEMDLVLCSSRMV